MSSGGRGSRGRVLVVDDDPDVHAMLRAVLLDEGYDVQSVNDGAEALAALREGSFHVVLLDLMMPNVSGWRFLEIYRQSPLPHTPVIVVSAIQRNALRLPQGAMEQVAEVVSKPFSVDHLLQTIRRVSGDEAPDR